VKQKPLLKVLLESEVRMNSLLFLMDSPRTVEQFVTSLSLTEEELLLHLVELEEYYIVTKDSHGMYELATMGKLLIDMFIPLLNTLDEIESRRKP
jgi:predicted transcriptional regulator